MIRIIQLFRDFFIFYRNMTLPRLSRQWLVHKLTPDFRSATRLDDVEIKPPGKYEMIVKNVAVGVSANDVNFAAGAYLPGTQPPFPIGFEAVGTVAAVGEKSIAKEGDHVAYVQNGAFGEYQTVTMSPNKNREGTLKLRVHTGPKFDRNRNLVSINFVFLKRHRHFCKVILVVVRRGVPSHIFLGLGQTSDDFQIQSGDL